MPITTTTQTVYRCSDGTIFDDFEVAVAYELREKIERWLEAHTVSSMGAVRVDGVVEAILDNRESLAQILNSVEPVIINPILPADLSVPCGPWVTRNVRENEG